MKTILTTLSLSIAALLFSSCSVQKRQYSSGYYISWNKKAASQKALTHKDQSPLKQIELPKNKSIETYLEPITASASPSTFPANYPKTIRNNAQKTIYNAKSTSEYHSILQENTHQKKKVNNPVVDNSSGKSQLIALILCLLIGILGIHRFYLGYIGIGIIQLLTFGGCGIWALIDLILIITGDLKPKNGDYSKKL